MKNIMLIGFVSLLSFTACNKDKTDTTATLADQKLEFQTRQLEIAQQKLAIDKEQMVYSQQKKTDSINAIANKKAAAVKSQPERVRTRTVYVNNTPRSSSSNYSNGNNTVAPAPRRRGWSSAAKGTVIGGVGGAAAGALIDRKNPGVGAIIGGLVGGGAGYTIGRAKDRRTGRVQPRN
jgi:hypothetical protein